MKRTQMQRAQYIAGMEKKKQSPDQIWRFDKSVQPIDSVNLALAMDAENARFPWIEEEINRLTRESWRIANKRANIHCHGIIAYRPRSKKTGTKQISVSQWKALTTNEKRKYEMVTRPGTGQPVETQRVVDMFMAARAAMIQGHKTLTGKEIEAGEKAASSACAMELRRAVQMPLFDDVMKAQKFWDHALEMEIETLPQVEQVIDPERFGDEKNRLRLMLSARRDARIRLARYWKSSISRQWKSSLRKDLILLREIVASACEGKAFAGEHDSSRRKSILKLAERINNPLMENDLQDVMATRREKSCKPLETIKLWRGKGVCGFVEYAQPKPQTIAKQELVEIPIDGPQCVTRKAAIADCGKYGFASALKTTLCNPITPEKAKIRRKAK
jgi:hypothetical protein